MSATWQGFGFLWLSAACIVGAFYIGSKVFPAASSVRDQGDFMLGLVLGGACLLIAVVLGLKSLT
jgi:hypothetical protein